MLIACSHTGFMNELLRKLKKEGFLTEDLMHGPQHSSEVSVVPSYLTDVPKARVPRDSYLFGVMICTSIPLIH